MFKKGLSIKQLAYTLVAVGSLLFLANSGILGALPAFIWVILLFVSGSAFWLATQGHLPMWQRIVGFAGIGIFAAASSGRFSGVPVLGFPAMVFGLIYLRNPKRWWALMPAGVLSSLALLVTFEELFPRWDATPVLFLGFAATFSIIYLLSPQRGGKRWALYPAILFIILTVLVNDPSGSMPAWFLPILLIGGGSLMLWWWRRSS